MLKLTIVVCLIAILGACATPQPLELHLETLERSQRKIDGELRSISIRTAPTHEQTGKVDWLAVAVAIHENETGAEMMVTQQWKSALHDALIQSLIFRDNAQKQYSLFIEIQKMEMGFFDAAFDVAARYRLMDRETGEYVYSKTIEYKGDAKASAGLFAQPRMQKGITHALKGNIELFLADFQAPQSH